MTECFLLVKEKYKKVCKRYISITGAEIEEDNGEEIFCDDMRFEAWNDWCLITLLTEDNFAEEILLKLSNKKKLLYFFSDDAQMDCEFLVIDKNNILRKKYIYATTPQLNEDEGYLQCEQEKAFVYWNDIDYFASLAKETPEKLFEVQFLVEIVFIVIRKMPILLANF